MVKTAEFGQPCRAPEPGRCRICRRPAAEWADDVRTVCRNPACVDEARREIGR